MGCTKLDAETFSDPQVLRFMQEHLVAIKIDVHQGPTLASEFGVQYLPALVFVDGNGAELDRIVGYVPPQTFLQKAARFQG